VEDDPDVVCCAGVDCAGTAAPGGIGMRNVMGGITKLLKRSSRLGIYHLHSNSSTPYKTILYLYTVRTLKIELGILLGLIEQRSATGQTIRKIMTLGLVFQLAQLV
jgi:hypothetical protein